MKGALISTHRHPTAFSLRCRRQARVHRLFDQKRPHAFAVGLMAAIFFSGNALASPASEASVASVAADVDDPPKMPSPPPPPLVRAPPRLTLELTGAGRVGAVAGHVWTVPAVGPAVGGGGAFRIHYRLNDSWAVSVKAGGVVGVADDGTFGFGYNAFSAVHLDWLRLSWLRLQSRAHLGLTGFLLIPIPTYGFAHSVTVLPVNAEFIRWSIRLGVITDALVVVPHLGVDLGTEVEFIFGPVIVGAGIRGSGDVLVAVVANQAAALAVAELKLGARF